MLWWMYTTQPTAEELEAEKNKTEQVQEQTTSENTAIATSEPAIQVNDSLAFLKAQKELGAFAYSANVSDSETVIENEVLKLTISNKLALLKRRKLD